MSFFKFSRTQPTDGKPQPPRRDPSIRSANADAYGLDSRGGREPVFNPSATVNEAMTAEAAVSPPRRSARRSESTTNNDAPVDPSAAVKRKARHRLIGAVVLVLTAVVLIPMLLDSEPRPLNPDIAIVIPPKDTPFNAELPPVKAAKAELVAKTEPEKPESPPSEPVKPSNDDAKKPPEAIAAAASKAADAKFAIQVGAFSSDDKAKDMQAKLKAAGFSTFTERVHSAGGERIRLRVGPFASHADAAAMLARVKSASGGDPVVVQ